MSTAVSGLSEPLDILAGILAGDRELSEATQALASTVRMHMDEIETTSSPEGWSRWVAFMRARGHISDLRARPDRLQVNDDGTVTAYGHWHGLREGVPVVSEVCSPRYRVKNGRIVELWTARRHYTLVFGSLINNWLGFLLIYCRFRIWAWLHHD